MNSADQLERVMHNTSDIGARSSLSDACRILHFFPNDQELAGNFRASLYRAIKEDPSLEPEIRNIVPNL